MKNAPNLLDTSFLFGNEIYFVLSEVDKYYPLHFHDFYELEIPIEGEGYEIINQVKYDISKSRMFLFRPTDYHEIIATKPLKIINIAFTSSILEESILTNFFDYDNDIVIDLTPNKLKQVLSTAEVIQEIFFGHRSNKELILSHLLNALLLIVIGSSFVKCAKNGKSSSVDVLRYIQANYNKNPSLQELSNFCGYQKNYFCDFFKKNVGMTYKEYLLDVKVNASKKLLKVSSKSIKEIAVECGFNNANNFIRKFKGATGLTPKQYRKLYIYSIK